MFLLKRTMLFMLKGTLLFMFKLLKKIDTTYKLNL